jgi:hypothetical protein
MDCRTHAIILAVTLHAACIGVREQTSIDASVDPPTFVEAEPGGTDIASQVPERLTFNLFDGLLVDIQAKPIVVPQAGWSFEIEIEFRNVLASKGAFDLGPEPVVMLSIGVTLADGSGYGSGGGCVYGSSLHGDAAQRLTRGERQGFVHSWGSSVEAGELLEVGISLCGVRLPDGRSSSGEIGQLVVRVDADGGLGSFELRTVTVPQPQP